MENFNHTNHTENDIKNAYKNLVNNGAGYVPDTYGLQLVARFDELKVYQDGQALVVVGDWNGPFAADIPAQGEL
jgi:hypothetical protein